jgi:hypothetical protein
MFIEGEFTPEQLKVIISRAAVETPKEEVEPSPAAEEATPEQVKQVKEHPEAAWVESPQSKQKPEPDLPQNLAEPHDTTGYSQNMGGICDTADPDKGKRGFQFEMPKET